MTTTTVRTVREVQAQNQKRSRWKTQCGSCRFVRARSGMTLWGVTYLEHRCVNQDAPALYNDGWRDLMGYEPHCDKFNFNANCNLYESRSRLERLWIPVLNTIMSFFGCIL